MNLKDYTLKIGYVVGGKYAEESVEYSQVKDGYSTDKFDIKDDGGENAVKIVVYPHEELHVTLAELIYDHYYENKERFFANGFQSWTSSREYKKGDVQYGLRTLSNLPIARTFSGASGDYSFANTAKICITVFRTAISVLTKRWNLSVRSTSARDTRCFMRI
ncbi:MAG: hypothetical protein L6V83_00970 [Christensenella sp.]|nr:MAG: hypothetical protein L6V83_00970 [Christensenella sp.]